MKTKFRHIITMMVLAPLTAFAQEDLGSINVTAARSSSPSITSSIPITVITRKIIDESHVNNLVTLLKGQANIVVRDTSGTGAKATVDLGGFGDSAASNKVVLIDGRRISNPDISEVDWTQIPLAQVERIEIMQGGGSVLYGEGAVGGVINIITRIPESGGNIGFSAGSYGSSKGHVRAGAVNENVRVEANFSGDRSDGYRKNSKLERSDGGARVEVDLNDSVMLHASGSYHRDSFGLPGNLTAVEITSFGRKHSITPNDYGNSNDSFIDAGVMFNTQSFEADLPVSVRRRESFSHSDFGGGFTFDSNSLLKTLSTRPKVIWNHSQENIHSSVTLGADIDRVDGRVSGLTAEQNRSGYYGFVTISDAEQKYVLSGGLRSERVEDVDVLGKNAIVNTQTAYDLGASVAMGDFRLRLNHNRSIRMPRLDERTPIWPATAFRTDLLPQTGKHYLASLRYSATDFWLEATVSRADLKNELYFDPTVGFVGQNENYSDPTRRDLFVVSANWNAHALAKMSANYTYTKAIFMGGAFSGNAVPGISKQRVGASWQADWAEGFSTTLFATYVGKMSVINDQANAQQKLGSYLNFDAVASYRWHDIDAFVRVDNLTNQKYSTMAAVNPSGTRLGYYTAPEISFRTGVSYHF